MEARRVARPRKPSASNQQVVEVRVCLDYFSDMPDDVEDVLVPDTGTNEYGRTLTMPADKAAAFQAAAEKLAYRLDEAEAAMAAAKAEYAQAIRDHVAETAEAWKLWHDAEAAEEAMEEGVKAVKEAELKAREDAEDAALDAQHGPALWAYMKREYTNRSGYKTTDDSKWVLHTATCSKVRKKVFGRPVTDDTVRVPNGIHTPYGVCRANLAVQVYTNLVDDACGICKPGRLLLEKHPEWAGELKAVMRQRGGW